jgi:hypothetical protein
VHAPPPVVLGGQVIGVAVDKQLFERRVHDVPPQAGKGAGRPRGSRFQAMTATVDSGGGVKIRTGT